MAKKQLAKSKGDKECSGGRDGKGDGGKEMQAEEAKKEAKEMLGG